jgi:lipopolysaccharide transport system ATP-binding protein
MMVRLAFAVSVCLKPDILIVDEALSVGDVFFQQKCFKRIHDLLDAGTSLLFVSHDTAAVQNLCNQAVLLKNGRQAFTGLPEEAVSRYFATSSDSSAPPPDANSPDGPRQSPSDGRLKDRILAHDILPQARSRHGENRLVVRAAMILFPNGVNTFNATVNDEMEIIYWIEAVTAVR